MAIIDRGIFAAVAGSWLHRKRGQPPGQATGVLFRSTLVRQVFAVGQADTVERESAGAAREIRPPRFATRVPRFIVSGRVRLGAIATVQTSLLPQALRAIRDRHPGLDVFLNESDPLLAHLKGGSIKGPRALPLQCSLGGACAVGARAPNSHGHLMLRGSAATK